MDEVFSDEHLADREAGGAAHAYRQRPWFLGKGHTITAVKVHDIVALPDTAAHLLFLDVDYADADTETYLVPLSVAVGEKAETILRERPESVLARLDGLPEHPEALLFGAVADRDFSDALLRAIVRRRRIRGIGGEIAGSHTRDFSQGMDLGSLQSRALSHSHRAALHARSTMATISCSSFIASWRRARTRAARFPSSSPSKRISRQRRGRSVRWNFDGPTRRATSHSATIGTLSSFVRNGTRGWDYTLDHLGLYFEHALAIPQEDPSLRELASARPTG